MLSIHTCAKFYTHRMIDCMLMKLWQQIILTLFSYLDAIFVFIRPSSDGTYYGMVMSVRPSGSPSVRPSIRPSQFSALFSYILGHIDLKFCVSLYIYARKIKFECHQFSSLFAGVMLLFNFKTLTNMQFSALFSYML